MRASDIPEISELNLPEKMLLVEDIWESIAADESNVPVPQSHLDELDKRFQRYSVDPGRLLSLEELQERIEKRK